MDWQKATEIFNDALDQPAADRAAFIEKACGGDDQLSREVQKLLAADADPDRFIDEPLDAIVAHIFDQVENASLIGRTLNQYSIERELGRGGMGEVYLARDTRLDRPVAIKVLPASFNQDPDRVRRFQQEARAVSLLNHPNIVTIHEVTESDSLRFIVSEFVAGHTLREMIDGGKIKPDQALDIVIQATSALVAAHQEGIIHRDIKPENLMVRPDGYVKVLDFGLAKLTEHAHSGPTEAGAKARDLSTQAGMVMGTVRYMSPEQARRQKVDQRSDIFSIGVVLYEMITGRPPFDGETSSHTIVAILEHEPPPISDCVPEVPQGLQAVIDRALRKNREDRYANISEILYDLQEIRHELQMQARQGQSVAGSGARSSTSQGIRLPQTKASTTTVRRFGFARMVVAGLVILMVTGATALIAYYNLNRTDSLAVLPFTYSNLNTGSAADADAEYLSDGMTETLIRNLSQLPGLKVIARTSVMRFKGKQTDPQEMGRQLDVRAILSGRIVRRGDRLEVSAELVDSRNNSHLWGQQYEITVADLQTTQKEITRAVSERLRMKLTGEQQQRFSRQSTANSRAYQFYLQGRYFWNKRTAEDINRGIEYYRQAIALDPNYALSFAGLAECYAVLPVYSDLPLTSAAAAARESASKALSIDESLAEPHAALGLILEQEWNSTAALNEYQLAIKLNSNYATAHQWRGLTLIRLGRFDEAFLEAEKAKELDPVSGSINSFLGTVFYHWRQYDRAIEQYKKSVTLEPDSAGQRIHLGRAYEQNGMINEAIAEYQKADAIRNEKNERNLLTFEFACVHARSGNRAEALKYLRMIQDNPAHSDEYPYLMAQIFAILGDKDQAFLMLNKAFEKHDVDLAWIKVEPRLDNLLNDPRLTDLSKRLGITQ